MKKLLLVLSLLLLAPSISFSMDEVMTVQGAIVHQTITRTSSDAVKTMPNSILNAVSGKTPVAVFITCETGNIRWTVGGVDPNRTDPLGHILYYGQSLRISSRSWIRSFRYTNEAAGVAATLQFSAEYNN